MAKLFCSFPTAQELIHGEFPKISSAFSELALVQFVFEFSGERKRSFVASDSSVALGSFFSDSNGFRCFHFPRWSLDRFLELSSVVVSQRMNLSVGLHP